MVKKAVIPCAGFGTRFLPATKIIPKELFPINGTPTLHYLIEEAIASGIEDILIIISPQKEILKDYFKDNDDLNAQLRATNNIEGLNKANPNFKANITFVTQSVMNGNGNAILLAKEFAKGEPIAVLFGDDLMFSDVPVTKQLIDAYEKTNKTIVGVQQTSKEVASRCGVMIKNKKLDNKTWLVSGIIEKPPIDDLPSELVSLGRFVLTNDIFDAIEKAPLRNGEVYLADALDLLAKKGDNVCSYEFDARRYDIGNKEGFIEATIEYALRDNETKEALASYLKDIKGF